jgi:hypothetical protein
MFQNSNTFNNLVAGNYTISIKDKKGCIGTVSVTITQPLPTASLIIALVNKTDVSCKNGSDGMIQVSASGGTSPYLFSLNGGPYTSNATFVNLTAATYTVTVKDANGCTSSISVTVKNGMGRCGTAITSTTRPATITTNPKFNESLKVQVSPNPATTHFTLLMQGNSDEKVEIVVTDIYGKKVYPNEWKYQ